MTKEDVISALRARQSELQAKGVARAALFGSVARGDHGPDSDIDIMVEIDPDARIGVWEYAGAVTMLEEMFPVRFDVSNGETLKSLVGNSTT